MASKQSLKPIQIWVSSAGPNGWKPVLILEELGLPYEIKLLSWSELMSPEFAKVNPVARVPAIYDPNTDLTLWESGAIILYIIDQYDTEKRLSYATLKEKNLLYQWLMYQMSQQGPMYGQASWFNVLHPEKIPSAIDRYVKQSERVMRILNEALEGKDWLVGDKCTYADLSYFMWNHIIPLSLQLPKGETPLSKFPNVMAWHNRMASREVVKKVVADKQKAMDGENLGEDGLPTDVSVDHMVEKLKEGGSTS